MSGSWMQKSAEGSCAGKQQHHGAEMQEKRRRFMGQMNSTGKKAVRKRKHQGRDKEWLSLIVHDQVHVLGSHQSLRQRVSIVRGQQLPDLPPLPLPVLPLWAVRYHFGLRRRGRVTLCCAQPPMWQSGPLSRCELWWTLRNSQSMVGVIRWRTVVERSRTAMASVRTTLRPGVLIRSISTRSVLSLRAVEMWQCGGLDVELQALSTLHRRACANPGDRGVGPVLADASCCLTSLKRCLLPAVSMEPVETFLWAAGASLWHVTLGTWKQYRTRQINIV